MTAVITKPILVDIDEVFDALTYGEQQEFVKNHLQYVASKDLISAFIDRDLLNEIPPQTLISHLQDFGYKIE